MVSRFGRFRVGFEGLGVAVRRRFSCCLFLGCSLSEDLFVDGGGFHLAAGVATPVVVGVDERGDCAASLGFGGEMPA